MMPLVPVNDVDFASMSFRLGAGLSIVRVQDVHTLNRCPKAPLSTFLALEQKRSIDPTGLHVRSKDGLHVRLKGQSSSVQDSIVVGTGSIVVGTEGDT
jgi:hypothetical protein